MAETDSGMGKGNQTMRIVMTIFDVIAAVALHWILNLAMGSTSFPKVENVAMTLAILALLRLREKGGAA
ncbi:hypothetical protein [Rhizobium sp. BK456]|uniref:hypothetical protein n=1 Tax=Rhizobium sp. BK456 TaxID=2587007 RepID=UPI00160EE7D5|nr:hypothetical protein [Rhizobium sp. BK456]MBB3521093.1 hypothetical protein [Rhizobium sp. BK456]